MNFYMFVGNKIQHCRSQWQCGIRRGSAAANLLGLRFRIPAAAWMSVVSVLCCQVETSPKGSSFVHRVSVFVFVTQRDQVQQ